MVTARVAPAPPEEVTDPPAEVPSDATAKAQPPSPEEQQKTPGAYDDIESNIVHGAASSAAHVRNEVTEAAAEFFQEPAKDIMSMWDTSLLADGIAGPAGVLVFTLHKGVDLMSADSNGLSDPYCIVKVHRSRVWRSKVIRKTLNPEWEQAHDFEGYLEDATRKPLKIRVYDFDVTSFNDPIGKCEVDISALKAAGKEHGLSFEDVKLTGVPHGSISFDVHFEVKPVFALFPGTPVHASAAQALNRSPPADATCIELTRDGLLRLLSRKLFLYLAILWVVSLLSIGVWLVVVYIGILIPPIAGMGTAPNVTLAHAPWSREAMLIGLDDDALMLWSNVCIQVLTGLFSYLNGIALPWRVSILCHHLSKRDSSAGLDFYGRPTDAIWFHIPEKKRLTIAILLNLAEFFHFATQTTRFVWSDYIGSNMMPGLIPINVTFAGAILFAIFAGCVQGAQEKKLMNANPDKYPPGVDKLLKNFYVRWRNNEIKLCSIETIKAFIRHSKEEKAKFHLANEMKRMSTMTVSALAAKNSTTASGAAPTVSPPPSPPPAQPPAQPPSGSALPPALRPSAS